MRYLEVDTASFTDADGRSVSVKELREIPREKVGMVLQTQGADFDEVASRPEVYGSGYEGDAYRLHEANIVQIFDALLDYSRVTRIKVPT